MGFFDFFKSSKSKGKKQDATTPLGVAREVQRLIEAQEYRDALDIAERGVYEYPRSEVMGAAYRFLRKTTLGEDVVRLKREMEADASPVRYSRLAEAYKEVGDYDKALDVCRKAIELFPDHEGPWVILARIRLERFKQDWIARDGELAVEYYEKAFDLNRNSYRTLVDLAELYTELGVKRRAIRKCEAILYFAPEDEKALALLRKARSLPDRAREDIPERIASYADKKKKAMLRRNRRPEDPLGPSGRFIDNPGLLQQKFEGLGTTLEGYYAAIGMMTEGQVVAAVVTGGVDREVLAQATQDMFEAANRCSLLMDIGQFKRGVFEGPSGFVYMVEFDELRLAVLCDPGTRFDRLEEAMKNFVEDELYR